MKRVGKTSLFFFVMILAWLAAFTRFGYAAEEPASGQISGRVMLVLDASGSMWGKIDGQHKIEIARNVIKKLMADWNPDLQLGLAAYGHRSKGDCSDIQTLIPVGENTTKKVVEAANKLNPKGKTPLSKAVILAAKHLRYSEEPATVILVTDGIETCNADPCAVGKQLAQDGLDFRAHIVGFDIATQDQQGLICLAENTGGQFFDARNAEELTQALRMTVEKVEEEFGPKLKFNVALVDGGEVLEGGYYAQGQFWKMFAVDSSGKKAAKPAFIGSGADVSANLEEGSYVAVLRWDAVHVEYPFSVVGEERAQHTITLNAAIMDLTASLTSGSGTIKKQVAWTIHSANADGSAGKKLLHRSGSKVQIVVPAGDILIRAKLDSAIVHQPMTVRAGERTATHLNLRAGSVQLSAVDKQGEQVRGYQTWTITKINEDGSRTRAAFKSDSKPRFILSAGKYGVELGFNKKKFRGEFEVKEGDDKAITVSVAGP